MKRVVIIGPGASGKSTLARLLGEITGLRVIMDGDLGPHDVIEVRLRVAVTIIFLEFSLDPA